MRQTFSGSLRTAPKARPLPLGPAEWINRIVYRGTAFTLGEWRCGPKHRLWSEENYIRDGHNLVFPRTCVYIRPESGAPMISTPNQTNFYNLGESYYRRVISPEGEISEYILVEPSVLQDAIRSIDPSVQQRPDRPFRFTHATCDSRTYLLQRMLFQHVNSGGPVDRVFLEETALRILHNIVHAAYAMRGHKSRTPREDTDRAHADLADAARKYIALHFREPIRIDEIARAIGTSMFHLCRVFHRRTGMPLHRFLSRMRLRAALECATDSRRDLTGIALDHGFASHSHFTDSFRREFGIPPSSLRKLDSAALARKLF